MRDVWCKWGKSRDRDRRATRKEWSAPLRLFAFAIFNTFNTFFPSRSPTHKHQASFRPVRPINQDQGSSTYVDLGRLLERRGYGPAAQAGYKKATKLGGSVHNPGQLSKSSRPSSIAQSVKSKSHPTESSRASDSLVQYKQNRHLAAHLYGEHTSPDIEFRPTQDGRTSHQCTAVGLLPQSTTKVTLSRRCTGTNC